MPSASVAPDTSDADLMDAGVEDPVAARRSMHKHMSSRKMLAAHPAEFDQAAANDFIHGDDNPDFSRAEWNRMMHEKPSAAAVHSAMKVVDGQQRAIIEKEIEDRKMKKYNTRVMLRVIVHDGDKPPKPFLMNVVNSIYLDELRREIGERCGLKGKFKLLWLNLGGETVELTSQRLFWKYADTMWCERPWELHVQEEGKAAVKALALNDGAKVRGACLGVLGSARECSGVLGSARECSGVLGTLGIA